jgi:hypothetical protein
MGKVCNIPSRLAALTYQEIGEFISPGTIAKIAASVCTKFDLSFQNNLHKLKRTCINNNG